MNRRHFANYTDGFGNLIEIEADSISALQRELPDDYTGPHIRVTDDHGFVRGWIGCNGYWTAT